jgi:hypothetical protein
VAQFHRILVFGMPATLIISFALQQHGDRHSRRP